MDENDFDKHQRIAASTAIYPEALQGTTLSISYVVMGLTGEAGEIANKYKKVLRDNNGELSESKTFELGDEIGDVLWYLAQLASEIGLSLSYIADQNSKKLLDRKDRNVLGGSGDKR